MMVHERRHVKYLFVFVLCHELTLKAKGGLKTMVLRSTACFFFT